MELVIILSALTLCLSTTAFAGGERFAKCPYGKFLQYESVDDLMAARENSTGNRTYKAAKASFIKGVRAEQIKAAFSSEDHQITTLTEAFDDANEGTIYKFEIAGSGAALDSYTVVYAYEGDTLVGAIFAEDTANVVAYMDDGDFNICEAGLAK